MVRPLPIQPEEIAVLKPSRGLSVSEWAEKKRILSDKTTNLSGRWSNDLVPFWVEPMESLSDSSTRQVTAQKPVQSGGTEVTLNFIGWAIDERPAPLLNVMPREDDAKRRVNTRIRPMFESTPSLLRHIGGNLDNINTGQETVLDNMIMYLAWSGSAAALADNPCCYVILDELGKYPKKSGKEADPVSLAKDRVTTFLNKSKIFALSTPVTEEDLICREYETGDKRKWWVKCPHCSQRHVMRWANVWLEKDSKGDLLKPNKYLSGHAFYVCPNCGSKWSEVQRWLAVCTGVWAPEGCTVNTAGRIIGKVQNSTHRSYHITAMMVYPGFITINHLAFKWAEAQEAKKRGDIGPLQNFINSYLAEPWCEKEKETDEKRLRKRIGTYPSQLVPAGVQILTAGLDVQADHVWASVDGWGYLSEVWSIFEIRIETGDTKEIDNWDLVRKFLYRSWALAVDPTKTIPIRLSAVDCAYNTEVVINFCKSCPEINIIPVRGDDSVQTRIYRKVKIAGDTLNRYDLNVNGLKDRIYRLMYDSDIPGGGYWHFHRDTTPETIEHLTSEELRAVRQRGKIRTVWKNKGNKPDHLWDCKMYSAFAAEIAGVYTLNDPDKNQPKKTRRVGQVARLRRN